MTGPVFEIELSFSDTTCRALLDLAIRFGSLSIDREPPHDFVEALRRLATQDEVFGVWCKSISSAADPQSIGSNETNESLAWRALASRLPHHLAASRPRNNAFGPQLLSLCNLIVRHSALETSFSAELLRQKTEAIYHFAYGLSHELNNPLANIATRAGLLLSGESNLERKRLLDSILANAMRGSEMLADLMLVARPPQIKLEAILFAELIDEIAKQATPWADQREVRFRMELNCECSLPCDRQAMREALWALIRNAIEAMPMGGEVTFSSELVRRGEVPGCHEVARHNANANCSESDGCLVIRVADRGCGLSSHALEHCFDPYYSGREAGRGLGLGLAKAKRIVDLHAGQINLYNRVGGGCVAEIVLPLGSGNSRGTHELGSDRFG